MRNITLLSSDDLHWFNEGTHYFLYNKLGAHPLVDKTGTHGVYFATWAPNAISVNVIGDFNNWDKKKNPLKPRGHSGIWEGFVPGAAIGHRYKFHIESKFNNYSVDKADPFGFLHETPPATASIVWDINYNWGDGVWMEKRKQLNRHNKPISIYEVHLGSWMREYGREHDYPRYAMLADKLVEYVKQMGFTHVEFLPVMEHPFYGSWGYQITGYFAPTSRYGTPQDFMYLIDCLHQNGIGVIIDWVPSHFPCDEHGLVYFDGTHLYEHADMRKGFHPDWNSYIFNYGRYEVKSFLISSAFFWLDKYHIDGLRVDAVASMLYLDYSRRPGEWIPNIYGGRENLEAIDFLRQFNTAVYQHFPDVQTIAEESTAWPMVSRPTYIGGLGFGFKWDMGWMHDTLRYFSKDPIFRKYHHNDLTFRGMYAFSENFILSLSHDEVVYGKGSMIRKMPGDDWQKFANLRALYGYQFALPGKKLLFMGNEFGQWNEWNHDKSLDWYLIQPGNLHERLQKWVSDLNKLYKSEPALYETDTSPSGFEWVDSNDSENSTLSFLRKSSDGSHILLAVFNFTPVPRYNYRIGVPASGWWNEVLNSDAKIYGGSGHGNFGGVPTQSIGWHFKKDSILVTLPPLSALFFKYAG